MLHTGSSYVEGKYYAVSNSRAKIWLTALVSMLILHLCSVTGFAPQGLTQGHLKSLGAKGGAWSALFKEFSWGSPRGFEVYGKIADWNTRRGRRT